MSKQTILLLHPGAMGASVGAALRQDGHRVLWVAAERSTATTERAAKADLQAVPTLADGLATADHVISVCPPDAATELAAQTAAIGVRGLYIDANAVAPATAREVAAIVGDGYVDGGIVGPPAWRQGSTRLYLSGAAAAEVVGWFDGSLLDARAVAGDAGAASALKMCYAAYTKGSSALLLAIRALAEQEGVADGLLEEWSISQPGLAQRSDSAAAGTSPKAWRFEGEMREIASTFAAAGLPDGFHQAAAEVYRRMADLKDADHTVTTAEVVDALLKA